MKMTFRWYGSQSDKITLKQIKQIPGCTGLMGVLDYKAAGEVWEEDEIKAYIDEVHAAGLECEVIESVNVHEDIKLGLPTRDMYIENYCKSIRNLAKYGVKVIVYNFMPVLDWIRTDLAYRLPDGSEALYFNQAQFAAFEIFILKRKGAEKEYTPEKVAEAKAFHESLSPEALEKFTTGLIDNFPGFKGVTLEDVRAMLKKYETLTRSDLESNLKHFLTEVCPVAEKAGCIMVIHPDDPPYSILGLPRIFSTIDDVKNLLAMVDSPANGVCFCAGSFSGRLDNNVVEMFKACADRVGFIHLRSTAHDGKGNFYEANHLEGVVDMYGLVKAIIEEQMRRKKAGRADWRIPFRPDHGHTMLDDLAKPPCPNPGYTAIGRLKGLAEIRGLEHGILKSMGV